MSKHVTSNPRGGWGVKNANGERYSKVFATQKEAIKYGTEQAKKEKTELFIHGKDGKIRERNSFGNDPYPPKG